MFFVVLKGFSKRLYHVPSQQNLEAVRAIGIIYLYFEDGGTEALGG